MGAVLALLKRRSRRGVGAILLLVLTGLSMGACGLSPGLDTPSLSGGSEDDDAAGDGDGTIGTPATGGGISSPSEGDSLCAGGAGGWGGDSTGCEKP